MARSFDGANDNLDFQNNTTVTQASLLSYSGWSFVNNLTQDHGIFDFTSGGTGIQFYNDDVGSLTGRTDTFKVTVQESAGAGGSQVALEGATGAALVSTWQHVALGVEPASATGLQLWINGVEDANSPGDLSGIGNIGNTTNTIRMGESQAGTRDRNGYLAEVAFWNRILDDAEFISLSKGYSPLFFRRGLVFYAPLIGSITTEVDYVGGKTATMNGALTKVPHPRIFYPTAPIVKTPRVITPAGDTLIWWSAIAAESPLTNPATLSTRNLHPVVNFDDTTQEITYFTGTMPRTYAGGNLAVYLHYATASATSGTAAFDIAFERISDSQQDIDADGFSTVRTITPVTVPGTTGHVDIVSFIVIAGTDTDSIAAGETFRLRVRRFVANDTAVGDLGLLAVEIREV